MEYREVTIGLYDQVFVGKGIEIVPTRISPSTVWLSTRCDRRISVRRDEQIRREIRFVCHGCGELHRTLPVACVKCGRRDLRRTEGALQNAR